MGQVPEKPQSPQTAKGARRGMDRTGWDLPFGVHLAPSEEVSA